MSGSMLRLARSEWRKASTTKLLWILAVCSLAWNALNVALLIFLVPATPGLNGVDPLMNRGYLTTVLATAGGASVFVLILAIIGMTGEYRHMTITSTFLATPKRERVLVAKGATYALIGAAIAVANVIAVFVLTVIFLLGSNHATVTPGTALSILVGTTLGLALYAVVGISVGALIKNQVAAIIIAVLWVLLAEPLLGLVSGLGKWLPGGALSASMNVTTTADLSSADLLPVWAGALLLLAYAAVFATLASLTTIRRDIT